MSILIIYISQDQLKALESIRHEIKLKCSQQHHKIKLRDLNKMKRKGSKLSKLRVEVSFKIFPNQNLLVLQKTNQ